MPDRPAPPTSDVSAPDDDTAQDLSPRQAKLLDRIIRLLVLAKAGHDMRTPRRVKAEP